jgi:hypothetical protein
MLEKEEQKEQDWSHIVLIIKSDIEKEEKKNADKRKFWQRVLVVRGGQKLQQKKVLSDNVTLSTWYEKKINCIKSMFKKPPDKRLEIWTS